MYYGASLKALYLFPDAFDTIKIRIALKNTVSLSKIDS
jgi:hypothetical protein